MWCYFVHNILRGKVNEFGFCTICGRQYGQKADGDDVDEINERNTLAVARRAWETGKPVVGHVDDEGNLTMRDLE